MCMVIADGGQWRLKGQGELITKAHLVSVFVDSARKLPVGKMEDLVPTVQEILRWDEQSRQLKCQIVWDDEGKKWGFFVME